jgi:protein gp37
MSKTTIQWTDHSTNPIRYGRGHFCQKISPGCAHCYASKMQSRFGTPHFGGAAGTVPTIWTGAGPPPADAGPMLWLDRTKLLDFIRRKKPTRYFVCDMTDLFGAWVPDAWIDLCFAAFAMAKQHTFQLLTKRIERAHTYLSHRYLPGRINDVAIKSSFAIYPVTDEWPLPNVWLGTSVEDQLRANQRIPVLQECPARVCFLSCEPLLGPLDLESYLPGLDWVIVGGESGRLARPCYLDWIRSLVQQCRKENVPCFVKQAGARVIATEQSDKETDRGVRLNVACVPDDELPMLVAYQDPKGGDLNEWPADLQVREFPR